MYIAPAQRDSNSQLFTAFLQGSNLSTIYKVTLDSYLFIPHQIEIQGGIAMYAGWWRRAKEDSKMCVMVAAAVVMATCLTQPVYASELVDIPIKTASQCFQPGVAFVSLYCGKESVVLVHSSFLGVHERPDTDVCSHVDSDCQVDAGRQFDWARCARRHSCVQIVQRTAKTPTCDGAPPSYMQVNYSCVSATSSLGGNASMAAIPPVSNEVNTPATAVIPPGLKATNICTNGTSRLHELYVHSPGFPTAYPPGRDCRCEVRADRNQALTVTLDSINLSAPTTSRGRTPPEGPPLCDDWLMLESPQYGGAGLVVCSDVHPARRSLRSRSSLIVLHFHSGPGGGEAATRRRGFRVRLQGSGRADLEVDCYEASVETALKSVPLRVLSVDPDRPYALPATNLGTTSVVGSGSAQPQVLGAPHTQLVLVLLIAWGATICHSL